MDEVSDLALKSAGGRKERILSNFFFIFFLLDTINATKAYFYISMLREKNKSVKRQTDNALFWQSFPLLKFYFQVKSESSLTTAAVI